MLTPSIPAVQAGKIFLVLRGELNLRYDPYYHQLEFKSLRKKFADLDFVRVGSLIAKWNRGDGPRDGFYTNDEENGVYFLRINNLKEHSVDLTDVKLINRDVHEKTLKRSQVSFGDIIFAISGTKDNLGTVSIVPENIKEANLNSALIVLKLKEELIDKKYFCLLFDLGFVRVQIDYIGKGAAQNNLNNQEISQIQIPLPPLDIQQKIITKFEAAYAAKRAKEAEAAQLLASIDGYLLEQLGITLPEVTEKKKVFFVCSDKVSGGRFDPFYFANQHFKIEGGVYENEPLKSIATLDKGQSITKDSISAGDYPVIAGGQTSPYTHQNYNQEGDVITVSASGAYAGYVWYHPERIFASDCTVIRSKNDDKISTLFLAEILKLKQKEIYNLQQGAGQPHVYASDLSKLLISVPPMEIQKLLISHINEVRAQAQKLEAEAKAEVEAAKKEVEAMILGKGGSA